MSDQVVALRGPDFTRGVPLGSLGEGELVLGHVGDKAAIIVRRGGQVFAVGAVCSHYGGPLSEGIVVGETVRCPWHHACFDLKSGEAVRAPALHPLPRWEVEQRDGKAYVTQEVTSPSTLAPVPQHARQEPQSVVIIGGGAAGSAAAVTLRRAGFAGEISMLSADKDAPYDRPNISKDYLAGTAPEEWIPLRPASEYAELGITLRLGARATGIDIAKRVVHVDDGTTVSYDALLLATGAMPVRLPPSVDPLQRVLYLRSLADSRAIVAAAEHSGNAVVIGASFIGLEVAAALRTRGLNVEIVAPEKRPLERILGTELGSIVQKIHEDHGAKFHLGNAVASIGEDHVILASGVRLPADLVVAGIGVRPDLTLANDAGLSVDKGVRVNEFLETSTAGIYAAGDIAEWTDPVTRKSRRIEHWVVAERQGAAIARNIMARFDGRPREPFVAVPFFWSAHYDTTISYVGHTDSWDTAEVIGDFADGRVAVSYKSGGEEKAVATIGYDMLSLDTELKMERSVDIALQLGVESDATLGRHKSQTA